MLVFDFFGGFGNEYLVYVGGHLFSQSFFFTIFGFIIYFRWGPLLAKLKHRVHFLKYSHFQQMLEAGAMPDFTPEQVQ